MRFPDQDHHLVLSELRTGEYEQYEEPVDPLARHAAYADPEDIDRDKKVESLEFLVGYKI